jgi:hypothetical protein
MERARTRAIQAYILDQAQADPRGLARRVAQAYGISRQAANRHLDRLVEAGQLEESGRTRAREYRLKRTSSLSRELRVTPVLNPDRIWEDHIAAILASDPPAVRDLCRGAFGELVRNAIEHAGADWITFRFAATAPHVDLVVADDGAGIFRRLAREPGTADDAGAAARMVHDANARAVASSTARLAILARNFATFEIKSTGIAVRFDAESDRWSWTRDASVDDGTCISFRVRR